MEQLIPVKPDGICGNGTPTVRARDLYSFLGVKTAFKDWFARRVFEYGFIDGEDFCSFLSESTGGRPAKEYAITINMAKELSMVERTEKGKEARAYFIECEKVAKEAHEVAIPQTLPEALRAFADEVEAHQKTKAIAAEMKPKADFVDGFVDSEGTYTLTAAAKTFKIKRKELIAVLERDGILFRRGKRLEPYSTQIENGRFETKAGEKHGHAYSQLYLTPKGMQWVAKTYMPELGEY